MKRPRKHVVDGAILICLVHASASNRRQVDDPFDTAEALGISTSCVMLAIHAMDVVESEFEQFEHASNDEDDDAFEWNFRERDAEAAQRLSEGWLPASLDHRSI